MGNAHNCKCNNSLCNNADTNIPFNNNSEILENDCYEDVQIEEQQKTDNNKNSNQCTLNKKNGLINNLGIVPEIKNENDSSLNNYKIITDSNNSNKNKKTKEIIEYFKSSNINILRKTKTKIFSSFNIKSYASLNIIGKNKKYSKSEIIKKNLKSENNNTQLNNQKLNKSKDNQIIENKAENSLKEKLSEKLKENFEEKVEEKKIDNDDPYNEDTINNNTNNKINDNTNYTSNKNTNVTSIMNNKNNNNSNYKNTNNIIINRNDKCNNIFIKKQNLTKNPNNIIKNNMLYKNPEFIRNKKNKFLSYNNSNRNDMHFSNFGNSKEPKYKDLLKIKNTNISDIEKILSKDLISKLTDTDIICSDNLEKIIKVPEKNKVVYNQRFCLLTKKYFSYYMSKGCFLQLDKPLFKIEIKNIKRIEQIYLDENTYFFAIICEINEETEHYVDKINSFASMGENGANEFLLGFRTSDIDLTIKWIFILNYLIMNRDENQTKE